MGISYPGIHAELCNGWRNGHARDGETYSDSSMTADPVRHQERLVIYWWTTFNAYVVINDEVNALSWLEGCRESAVVTLIVPLRDLEKRRQHSTISCAGHKAGQTYPFVFNTQG